eukprot:m.210698 g.210698  ORF g.210698 m.210698 type:complete len:641 (+) comp33089_c0_seq1:146-2068(+)
MSEQVSPDLQLVNRDFLCDFLEEVDQDKTYQSSLEAKLNEYAIRFNHWDQDQSGDMDVSEVTRMLESMGHEKSEKDVLDMVNKVDDDNTGTIRYREFVNLMLIHDEILNEPVVERAFVNLPSTRKSTFSVSGFFGAAKRKKRGALRKPKRGHIRLDIRLTKTQLIVQIFEASSLLACDLNGKSDPYVKLKLEPDVDKESKRKTAVSKKTLDPVWNETITYELAGFKGMERLQISIWDWDLITKNDFMGAVSFSLEQIKNPDFPTSGWFKLLDVEQGARHAFPQNPSKAKKQTSYRIKTRSNKIPYTLDNFDLLKVLGRGSFGKVFLAQEKRTKTLWAIKCLKKAAVIADDDLEATLTERRVLTLEGQPHFLTHMHASFQTPQCLFYVMELITGGDLMHLYESKPNGKFSEAETRFYIAEVVCGLFNLHDRGILYRDLKLDNVMVDSEGHVKLADFGLAKFVGTDADDTTQTFCGTPDYIAPEIVNYHAYNKAVDYWSLGVMMYEMLTAEPPFAGDSEDELFSNIVNTNVFLPRYIGRDSVELLRGWLCKSPAKRLTDKTQIKSHRYFNPYSDWGKLESRGIKPPWVPKGGVAKNFHHDCLSQDPTVTPPTKKQISLIASKSTMFKDFDFVQGTVEEMVED